jgi:ABC-2 type transport system ATP-binding protein
VHRPTLDDVFLALTGRSLRDAEASSEGAAADAAAADGPDGTDGTDTTDAPEAVLR